MMSENPWREIAPPDIASTVNARRVDARLPWDFFWARDADGGVLLTLSHDERSSPKNPLPILRDIEVSLYPPGAGGSRILALRLLETNQVDLFHTLCLDIIDASTEAESESEAVSVVLMRTWRWHHLLREGGSGLLSRQAQMGLLGELFMLECYMLPNLDPSSALEAWRGPLDSPKDFEIGGIAIEVKVRRGGATSHIAITSVDQLDESGVDQLFLYVVDLHQAPADGEDGVTVQEVADRILAHLKVAHPEVSQEFEGLLLAAGLDPDDDYSDHRWLEGTSHFYTVTNDFPRILPREVRSGVARVSYTVSLGDCEPFRVMESQLVDTLVHLRGRHGY